MITFIRIIPPLKAGKIKLLINFIFFMFTWFTVLCYGLCTKIWDKIFGLNKAEDPLERLAKIEEANERKRQ